METAIRKLHASIGKIFELYDIDEIISPRNRRKIADNIAILLSMKGVLPRGARVLIPVGADEWYYDDSHWIYGAGFEIFDRTGQKILATGRVSALGMKAEEGKVELYSIEVTITEVL